MPLRRPSISAAPTAPTAWRAAPRARWRSRPPPMFRIRARRRRSSPGRAHARGAPWDRARRAAWRTAWRSSRRPTSRASSSAPPRSPCCVRPPPPRPRRSRSARKTAFLASMASFGCASSAVSRRAWRPFARSGAPRWSRWIQAISRMEPPRSCVDAHTLNAGSAQLRTQANERTRVRRGPSWSPSATPVTPPSSPVR